MKRRVRVAAALALLGLAATGCGAGQGAATAQDRPSVPGINVQDNGVAVRNARVIFAPEGYQPGETVPIVLTFFNENPEPVRLVAVSSSAATGVELAEGAGGQVELPPFGYVESQLALTGVRSAINAASTVPLELVFNNDVTFAMDVPVAPPLERVGVREPLDLGGH